MIYNFNQYINESLKDKLKGKSENDILDNIENLSPHLKLEKGCRYGVLSIVKQAIEKEINDYEIEYGFEIASLNGHLHIIKYLLNNTDIHPDIYGGDPIKYAFRNNHLKIVKFLLNDKRVDPSRDNNYLLIKSIERSIEKESLNADYIEIIKLLLKDKRVINKLNNNKSLKKYKEQINNLNINESLKDKLKGKSENEILNNTKNLSPLEKLKKGSIYGILPLVKQAIEEGADPSYDYNIVLILAVENNHLDIVKELLKDKRVDPSNNYSAPIRFASEYGHLDIVKELLKDDRVDPSDIDNYAIHNAFYNGYYDVVKELLKDKRVRNKLNKEELELYKNQINNLNESLKNKLKGKTEKDILEFYINFIENTNFYTVKELFDEVENSNDIQFKYGIGIHKIKDILNKTGLNENASISLSSNNNEYDKFLRLIGRFLYDGMAIDYKNQTILTKYKIIIYKLNDYIKDIIIFDKNILLEKLNKLKIEL